MSQADEEDLMSPLLGTAITSSSSELDEIENPKPAEKIEIISNEPHVDAVASISYISKHWQYVQYAESAVGLKMHDIFALFSSFAATSVIANFGAQINWFPEGVSDESIFLASSIFASELLVLLTLILYGVMKSCGNDSFELESCLWGLNTFISILSVMWVIRVHSQNWTITTSECIAIVANCVFAAISLVESLCPESHKGVQWVHKIKLIAVGVLSLSMVALWKLLDFFKQPTASLYGPLCAIVVATCGIWCVLAKSERFRPVAVAVVQTAGSATALAALDIGPVV